MTQVIKPFGVSEWKVEIFVLVVIILEMILLINLTKRRKSKNIRKKVLEEIV
jgi:hypothetical protein